MQGDLQRQVAQSAEAEERDRLAGRERRFAERAVRGPTGAAEGRGIGGGRVRSGTRTRAAAGAMAYSPSAPCRV